MYYVSGRTCNYCRVNFVIYYEQLSLPLSLSYSLACLVSSLVPKITGNLSAAADVAKDRHNLHTHGSCARLTPLKYAT